MPAAAEQTGVRIAEDGQSLVDPYGVWLAGKGDVQVAYAGGAALEGMADREKDGMPLNRRMPGLSVDEVPNRLDENGCDAQVVMVTTALLSPEIAALPVDGYIEKPVERAVTVELETNSEHFRDLG